MAIRALLIDLASLLKKEGSAMAQDLKGVVPIAEGKLRDSVRSDVRFDGAVVTMELSAAPHFRFVDLGRRPRQKAPPSGPGSNIRRWCEVKGIDVKFAFVIARSIGIRGIPGKHILPGVIQRHEKGILSAVRTAFGEGLKVETENLIKRTFPTKQ
jgi:hypothetical protein